MPLDRPTLPEIISRIEADMSSRLIGGAPVVRRSVLGVLSRVFAGAVHMLYGFVAWLSNQIVPGAISNDPEYLEKHADSWGIIRIPPEYAIGNASISGTAGVVIPKGTILQRSDGVQYASTTSYTVPGSNPVLAVQSIVAGASGNAVEGVALTFASPISGVTASASVATGGIGGGADGESDDALRTRLLYRIQNPPQGGSVADYEIWATLVAGVSKAYCFPLYDQPNNSYPAPGYVGVAIIGPSGIPDGGTVSNVQAYLNNVRPVSAVVTAYAPTAQNVSFTINISPNNADVRAAIKAEITDLFAREARPNSTITLSHINEAISVAVGEVDHVLVAPSANIVSTRLQFPIALVDSITWGSL